MDLPLPPEPTSAMRVGRVARIVRASVATSALRPFMPRGGGGKIERRDGAATRVFDRVFFAIFAGLSTVPLYTDKIAKRDRIAERDHVSQHQDSVQLRAAGHGRGDPRFGAAVRAQA